jgi:hypothetical protein
MRGTSVNFNLRCQFRVCERLFENVFILGRPRVIIGRNRDEELRLGLSSLQIRTIRRICHQSAAVEGADRPHAIGHGCCGAKCDRAAHAVPLRADLPVLGHRRAI